VRSVRYVSETAAEQCREYKTHARLTKPGDPEADIIVRDGNTEIKYQVKDNKKPEVGVEEISKIRYSGKDLFHIHMSEPRRRLSSTDAG
ncbi:hypothetical protein, partial [Brachyspira hyodysenteriae]|uniref:hypothetical protein n=1 Tax=Brachyspira hyodysenteriae TaxID=159 RepID=UPI0011981ED0